MRESLMALLNDQKIIYEKQFGSQKKAFYCTHKWFEIEKPGSNQKKKNQSNNQSINQSISQ